ncbi:ankyrin repeat domain-containing protein [Salmonella enterica]|uniref:ankyrin repeat domain-containing protein n=1 Tax=Salmonella enterica TaxID=28901 RepID=UPI001F064D8D|nr:ankyrin repeat domain-containing protein [Salmonella enterica]
MNDFQCKFDYVEQCKSVTIPERNNALSVAVTHANTEAVYFLVNQAKTDVNGITGRYHETPLMIAAYYGTKKHQEIASFLISRGANVNAIDLTKMTILQTAIWKNNMDFVKMLLENGADPSLTYNGKRKGQHV